MLRLGGQDQFFELPTRWKDRRGSVLASLVFSGVVATGVGCIEASSKPDEDSSADSAPRQDQGVEQPPALHTTRVVGEPHQKIDLLFVIDNSGTMCEEQRALTDRFELIAESLLGNAHPPFDFRIAVVSTDMHPPNGEMGRFLAKPAEPVPSPRCTDRDTGTPITPNTADCVDVPTIIKSGPESTFGGHCDETPNPAECRKLDLQNQFRCMATLGVMGDGFEKGLEAMRVALSCNGPNRDKFGACCHPAEQGADARPFVRDRNCRVPPGEPEPEFLRPDALLAVVIVSDEDDCSDPAVNPQESRRIICRYGPEARAGGVIPAGYEDRELCGGLSPAECYVSECGTGAPCENGDCSGEEHVCIDGECVRAGGTCFEHRCRVSRSENSQCEWRRDELVPVRDYFEFLTSLKLDPPQQLVVAAIVGIRDYTPARHLITYSPGDVDTRCMECLSDSSDGVCMAPSPDYDPNLTLDDCCPQGRCVGHAQPSCFSNLGAAYAGKRYLELTDYFGGAFSNGIGCPPGSELDPSECINVCVNDFEGPLAAVRNRFTAVASAYCLDRAPSCEVQAEAQSRPCQSEAERSDVRNYCVQVRRQCLVTREEGGNCERFEPSTALDESEFTLVVDEPGCPSGALIRFASPLPPGAEALVEYRLAP